MTIVQDDMRHLVGMNKGRLIRQANSYVNPKPCLQDKCYCLWSKVVPLSNHVKRGPRVVVGDDSGALKL